MGRPIVSAWRFKARIGIEKNNTWANYPCLDCGSDDSKVTAAVYEFFIHNFNGEGTGEIANRIHIAKMLNDFLGNIHICSANFNLGPIAFPVVENLKDMLGMIPASEFKERPPFDQIPMISVPSILHKSGSRSFDPDSH
jgi:hypothetical protein